MYWVISSLRRILSSKPQTRVRGLWSWIRIYTFEKNTASYIKICTVYKVLDFDNDHTEAIIAKITVTLNRLVNEGVITQDMANFATPRDTKPGRFYLLSKIHNCGVRGRPVISSCSSPTKKFSELVDHFIKPLVPGIPS